MGAAPSHSVETVFSYFRGSYEIGLIPLTKKFFSHPARDEGDADGLQTAEQIATAALRQQFLLMRRDPAIVYANSREEITASWPELFANPFTEEDLDAFLDLVDKDLYATDAEMIADSGRAILPVPCALCLACKDGQERPGCFLWHGRSIVIIGYFGCMSDALRKALKIRKGKLTVASPSIHSNHISTDDVDDHTTRLNSSDAGGVRLFMNAAVLASAGDRTMERVLVLASVMLRNQYLEAAIRVANSVQCTAENPTTAACLDTNHFSDSMHAGSLQASQSMSMTESQVHASPTASSQVREEALRTLEQRLLHLTLCVESSIDNYSSLKSMTENVAFVQCQIDVDPNLCVVELPDNILTAYSSMESNEEVHPRHQEHLSNGHGVEEEHRSFAATHLSQPDSVNEVLEFDGEVENKEHTKNDNPSSAFAVVPITITDNEAGEVISSGGNTAASTEITNDLLQDHPASSEVNLCFPQREKNDGEKKHLLEEETVKLVRVCFEPGYVAKAILWASSLLTVPVRIAGGSWVQYKLKDESEELRQTLHGKDAIVARWREEHTVMASSYMGENTTVLLQYVRALQKEVEHARTLPQDYWTTEQLIGTREGRTCALYYNPCGTMLIGIRSRVENEEAKKKVKKERTSKEDICPREGGESPTRFNAGRDGVSRSNPTKSNGSGSDTNVSPSLVTVPGGLYKQRAGPAAFFPVANTFMPPSPPPIQPPPPFPFFQPSSAPMTSAGVSSTPMIISAVSGANNESAHGNQTNPEALPVYLSPPSFALASTAASTGPSMQSVYNGFNGVPANDGTYVAPPPHPMQSGAAVQAMPFPYPMVSQSASPARTFVQATPPTNPIQQLQQQQQLVFMQQPAGSGGVPMLVPMTVAPQQPSFLPAYGFPMGAGVNQSVLTSRMPPAAQHVSAGVPQNGMWNPPPLNNGVIMGNGQPNYVYYFPAQ